MRYSASEMAEKKAKLLGLSTRLFLERGFDGASVADIMNVAGLTHGPFYRYFSSKTDLQIQSIENATRAALKVLETIPRTEAGRASYISKYLSAAQLDNPGNGCTVASLAPEIARNSALRPAVSRHIAAVSAAMAYAFPFRERGETHNAIQTLTAMVGAVVLNRGVEDPFLAEAILNETRLSLLCSNKS